MKKIGKGFLLKIYRDLAFQNMPLLVILVQ